MGSLPSKPSKAVSVPARPVLPPSGLTRLPNELLLEIAGYLTTTRDVSALLRTSPRLAALLEHVLSAMLLQTYHAPAWRGRFSTSDSHCDSLVRRLTALSIDLDATVCNCEQPSSAYCPCAPALHRAITQCNLPMIATLLRYGASITSRCPSSGLNAVHHAIRITDLNSGHFRIARDGDLAILRALLSRGRLRTMNAAASLSAGDETWLVTAVRTCPRSTDVPVRLFLVRGLHVNTPESHGWTALHIAVLNNRPDLVRALLHRGADHRTVDRRGITPWASACRRPNCEVIAVLLWRDAGLVVAPVRPDGQTAEECVRAGLHGLLAAPDEQSEYWVREVRERTEMVARLERLGRVARSVVGVRCVLQVYDFVR